MSCEKDMKLFSVCGYVQFVNTPDGLQVVL